jgi:S1 RNA binding domain protein
MQVRKGEIVKGKVTGITKYGAFVRIDNETSGMVHISEMSSRFVKDINDVIEINQEIQAVVIDIAENGKLTLSIKQLPKDAPDPEAAVPGESKNPGSVRSFEEMMSKFKRDSDEKIADLKFLEPKRSGQPRRRKD